MSDAKDYCEKSYKRLVGLKAGLYDVMTKTESVSDSVHSDAAKKLRSLVADIEAGLSELNNQCPSDWSPNKKELEVLLTDINNLGKTAGVEILSFTRTSEVIHDFYAEVPIKITLDGEYHDVGKFFELMARLPRIVNMGALSISIADDTMSGTRLSISGVATAFRFVGSGAGV